jgi:hypothetical protein
VTRLETRVSIRHALCIRHGCSFIESEWGGATEHLSVLKQSSPKLGIPP